jgi:hypothetical protein
MRETNKALEDRLTLCKNEISKFAAEPRGDLGREPDQSADRARKPQIFRPHDQHRGAERTR